jgi:primosomal protein N' (replication factor Y) (superfamily II helicase)
MPDLFAEVALFIALDKTLHYQVPSNLLQQAQTGVRVLAPLGKRKVLGLIVKLDPAPPVLSERVEMRPLLAVLDHAPVVPEHLLDLCFWISEYYFYPLGEVLQLAVPAKARTLPEACFLLGAKARQEIKNLGASALIDLLSQKETVSFKDVKRKLGYGKKIRAELQELEHDGVIERFYRFDAAEPTSRKTGPSRLRLIAHPPVEFMKNRNMADLIGLFENPGDTITGSALRKRIKNAAYYIKKLVKTGCLEFQAPEEEKASECERFLPATAPPPDPSSDQKIVLDAIQGHISSPSSQAFLVFGVTGSGKSEIYLRLAEAALRHDRGVLILVPEIALTFQMEALFRDRFGSQLATWHSGLSTPVREARWHDILSGRKRVVLGARSAIFMPVLDLGLIVIDEEHDSSYKQDDHLRYQARDVALMRARMLKIPIVLGSATPSLQSLFHVQANRYRQLALPRRIYDRPLPDLEVIDMRREKRRERVLSKALKETLTETIGAGQQALLFLNRRGFASFVLCNSCGHVQQCENCSVSLTYHDSNESLWCHYCGTEKKLPARCPVCDHASLILHGFGTERIEKEVKKLLPEARILRIDRDTASEPGYLAECLDAIRAHRANVLIGTQMLTKGHDLPNITLVGVVNADTSLQIADFRAGETTVQLLMQVAGRAGRGDRPGRVILQTYNPSHYTIQSVLHQDYLGFCGKELESRERLQYPPFVKMLRFLVTSTSEELTRQAAHDLADLSRSVAHDFRSQNRYLAILGPSPAPLVKLKNRFRWHIYVKTWMNQDLQQFTEVVLEQSRGYPLLRRVQLAIDRDPTMVM